MKTIIHRVFARKEEPARAPAPISAVSSELTNSDIENYYLRIIVDSLRRMLVPPETIEVGVKRAGVGPSRCAIDVWPGCAPRRRRHRRRASCGRPRCSRTKASLASWLPG